MPQYRLPRPRSHLARRRIRRAEHFRRDLLQAESLAVQQTNEVDLIRIQLKNETNNARKSINKAEGK